MRVSPVLLVLVSAMGACRDMDPRQPHDVGEPQIVSLVVRSEPPGAQVRVDKLQKTWTTPCDIADFSLGKGTHEVEVSLPGYQTVAAKARYDGYDPVILQVKLAPTGAPAAVPVPPAPPPVPAPAPPPAAVPPAGAPEPAPAATARLEAAPGGARLRVTAGASRIRIQAKSVVADPDKPGEYFLPNVPPEKVLVEFLDPATGAVLHSVEFAPPAAGSPAMKAPEAPAVDAARVGEVKVVSKTYGVFVKLDPGLALQPGEEILIYRDGREVARSKILRITRGDSAYPDGAAQVQKDSSIQTGDEVRRLRP